MSDPGEPRLPGVVAYRGPGTWTGMVEAFLGAFANEGTRRNYRTAIERWGRWCAEHHLDPLEASRSDVRAFTVELGDIRAPSTVKKHLAALAGIYEWLVDEGRLDRNPTQGVKRPKVPDESTSLGLDPEAAGRFLTAADAHSALAGALCRVLLLNGLRASEPLRLDVANLVWQRGKWVLTGVRLKGGKRRTIPLADGTVDALNRYLAGRRTGPLFLVPGTDRRRLDYYRARRLVKQIYRDAGLPAEALKPHDLRHSFVTFALDAGAPLHRVQDAAGHADPRTTRRYDRARHRIDDHPTGMVADYLADGGHRGPTIFDDEDLDD